MRSWNRAGARKLAALLVITATLAARPAGARQAATTERPRPYPVLETRPFSSAVERGTRTRTGRPGPSYWQQYAEYRLGATLDPASRRLTGEGSVRYHNRSPDTLRVLAFHLYQNLFAPNAIRNEEVPITGGVQLARVAAQGRTLSAIAPRDTTAGYLVDGTIAWVRLPRPIPPGGSADLEFAWSFLVPPDGAPRGGTDGEVFYIAYWYPQAAVYDDVVGWQTDPYMGNAEFHMGFADYDVALALPAGWLVAATGTLRNPEGVLSPAVRQRLEQARRSSDVVHVVTAPERGGATLPGRPGLTWRFQARNVRDFAWGASDKYLWDATHAVVGDRDGDNRPDTALVHAFYRPERTAWAWAQEARYGRHSVEFLSRFLWPYPWPHMTAVDGPASCGGMEYPMMTCIGGPRDTLSLYSVTVHEIAHMWFPMQAASDEKRHSWQDEGLTRFNQANAMREFFRGYDLFEQQSMPRYLPLARLSGGVQDVAIGEIELMRHGDLYPIGSPAFVVASYEKMALILRALRAILGEETFMRAYREYGRRWAFKHPKPFDFWNTFEDVAGRDLDWFWRTWFYEVWTLDQAIAGVRAADDSVEITIEDRGLAPMPVRLAVTRADGRTQRLEVPVDVWLQGARRHTLRLPAAPAVVRVEIDPDGQFPDVDRTNQEWRNGSGSGSGASPLGSGSGYE